MAGTGAFGFGGDNNPAAQARFAFLTSDVPDLEEYSHLTVDAQGNIFIADQGNDRVRKVAPNGIITTVAGNGRSGFGGDQGPATEAMLFSPIAVALDAAGNLYIVDQDNDRVRRVDPSGLITTIVGNGDPNAEPGAGNNGPALQASLNAPGGLALDAAGNLYISDTYNNQVRRVTRDGRIAAFVGDTSHSYGGDGGRAILASLDFPAGLAFDAAGNLYIADQHNSRIRRVSTDGIITTFAGNGFAAFSGDGGPATEASLNYPSDVAFDAAGNLYIADERNNRIRKVTPDGIITTVVGTGGQGYAGDGGPPLSAALNRPSGLAFDRQGNLYITDHYNYRIRSVAFNPPVLAASPASFSFVATAGGAAPAPQTFSLSNPGTGTLNYTIASDQPWLTATPAAGVLVGGAGAGSSATITVRASISLAAGDYSGTLTIRSAEAVNSPQIVRVTLTVRPAAPAPPTFAVSDVAQAASFVRGPVAPGEIISIFGSNLGPQNGLGATLDPSTGRLAATLGGVTVLFNDVPGALFFVRQDQINVQVPYELPVQNSVRIVVRYLDLASAPVTAPMVAIVPGIFAVASGTGPAAMLNQDSTVNSATNPAARNSVVQIFLTGQGATNPPAVTGQLTQAPYPMPVLPVTVKIGGKAAQTTFIGLAPQLAGLLQINAVVPEDTVPGDNVALEVTIGTATSQPGVTMSVR